MSSQGFLSRWSKRKVEAKEAPVLEAVVQLETEEETSTVALVPESVEETIPQEEQDALIASLPDIETLTDQSDFSGFLKQGVPEELKKMALRKLWRSNPIFANLDGLNDYDEDFTKITPLAAGVADELLKLMKENSRHPIEEDEEGEEEPLDDAAETEEVQPKNTVSEAEDDGIDDDLGDGEDDF